MMDYWRPEKANGFPRVVDGERAMRIYYPVQEFQVPTEDAWALNYNKRSRVSAASQASFSLCARALHQSARND